ncbi:hypothetical protein [Rhizorhabdus argentea]|uniref:hypothetical protein n=1 Tax=Rhizorhabdus argentea TaxID=1387174 RepID=UPI0030ED049E
MAQLTGFEITRRDEDYLIHLNTDDGNTVEIVASYDQMDLIAEEIDRQLDSDEEDALAADEDTEADS